MEIEEGAIRLDNKAEADSTEISLHNSSDDTKGEFNNCFIIHSKWFLVYLNRMLSSSSIACLSASLGDKRFLSSANILQIVDGLRVFFLLCF